MNFIDKILHKNDIKIYEQTVTLHEIFDFFKKIEKIQIGLTLEKFWGLFIWTRKVDTINKTFYCSGSNQSISYDLAKSGLDTGTYRSVADFTVTLKDGRVEKFTRYSAEVKVP